MNRAEIEAIRNREIAMLDQLEAAGLEMLRTAQTACERRAIRKRLRRLHHLQVIWAAAGQPNRGH